MALWDRDCPEVPWLISSWCGQAPGCLLGCDFIHQGAGRLGPRTLPLGPSALDAAVGLAAWPRGRDPVCRPGQALGLILMDSQCRIFCIRFPPPLARQPGTVFPCYRRGDEHRGVCPLGSKLGAGHGETSTAPQGAMCVVLSSPEATLQKLRNQGH